MSDLCSVTGLPDSGCVWSVAASLIVVLLSKTVLGTLVVIFRWALAIALKRISGSVFRSLSALNRLYTRWCFCRSAKPPNERSAPELPRNDAEELNNLLKEL